MIAAAILQYLETGTTMPRAPKAARVRTCGALSWWKHPCEGSVFSVEYQLPDGRIVAIRHDEGDFPRYHVTFGLENGRIVVATRIDATKGTR